MDSIRYYVALLTVVTVPQACLFWFSIHPFVRFWRRMGTKITYGTHLLGAVAIGYPLFRGRASLLATDYGTNRALVGVALVLYVASVVIELQRRKHLTTRILVGLPELQAEDEGPGILLEEGIYGRVRHPRYVSLVFGIAAVACFSNYLATWIGLAAIVPVVRLLVVVEEYELKQRFGADYARYMERVPRFVPALR